ncbi:MAG: phage portal protein family protein, partial [Flavobacteriaceae bacterium]
MALDNYNGYPSQVNPEDQSELEQMLYARHAEIKSLEDLEAQRGTPIPALFNQFYKFVQNPSTVSVETFKRMIDTDDTIGSGVDFLTTCLAARLGRYTHPSEEITKFVNEALGKIQNGFHNCIKELLGATWAGFAVQEKVWANDDMGFIVKKLVSLPPGTLLFETERTGELTNDGILQYQRNYNPALLGSGTNFLFGFVNVSYASTLTGVTSRNDPYAKLGDMPFPLRTANTYSYLSIRIPVQKCIHYSFDAQGKFGNPYGRSLLRRAYKWYVTKDAFLQMLAVALDRKGTPLTIVFADPNTTLRDPSKAPTGNVKGQFGMGERADQAAQRAFRNIHNDSTIILPGKKGQVFDTDFVPQTSNAQDFLAAVDMCNKSIMRALLIPSLVFGNGDGTGSYSLGQEHAKTFEKILDGMLAGLKDTLIQQLVSDLIKYNFPEAAYKKDGFGDFSKRELSQDEIGKEIDVLEKAVNIGAVDMNDLNDLNSVRDKLGMEPLKEVIKK